MNGMVGVPLGSVLLLHAPRDVHDQLFTAPCDVVDVETQDFVRELKVIVSAKNPETIAWRRVLAHSVA